MEASEIEGIKQELIHAIGLLSDTVHPTLIPHDGMKIGYASYSARSPDEVGYVIITDSRVQNPEEITISFGLTNQVISVILTAIRFASEIRCVYEIRFSQILISLFDEMLWEVCIIDEETIPKGGPTMDWTVAFCNDDIGGIPDAICLNSKKTDDSRVWIFGENPVRGATNILKISQRIIDATH